MNIYYQLIRKGFYVGSSYDIFTEKELEFCRTIMSQSLDRGYDQKIDDSEYLWYYTFNGGTSDNFPSDYRNFFIPYNKLEEYKDVRKQYNCIRPSQQWFFSNFYTLMGHSIFWHYNHKIIKFVESIYKLDNDLEMPQLSVTYYSKGDYIDIHRDGRNEGRVCGILIYLPKKEQYDTSYGGRFFIEPSSDKKFYDPQEVHKLGTAIQPVQPNYILLDFTKNDCYHAVEEVKEDFGRYAIFGFISEKNNKTKRSDYL